MCTHIYIYIHTDLYIYIHIYINGYSSLCTFHAQAFGVVVLASGGALPAPTMASDTCGAHAGTGPRGLGGIREYAI